MPPTNHLSPCVVCGDNVSPDCRCRICDRRLHVFCAVPEGLEGHGAKYLCSADCCGTVAPLGVAEVAVTVDNVTVSGVDADGDEDVLENVPVHGENADGNEDVLENVPVHGEDAIGESEDTSMDDHEEEPDSVADGDWDRASLRRFLTSNPLKGFYRLQRWSNREVEAAKGRDLTPVTNFVSQLCRLSSCVDSDKFRFLKCSCLKSLPTNQYQSIASILGKFILFLFLFFVDCQLIFFALLLLVSFALLTKGVRQTLFKERVAAAISRKQGYQSLYRKRSRSVSSNSRLYFRLLVNGSEIPMCGNAYRNLFLLRRKLWKSLNQECSKISGPIIHGNVGNNHRSENSFRAHAKPSVISFLSDVRANYGEAYATRFVREVTGMSLRGDEIDGVELPSRFTKHKLYAEYCYGRGYKVKANAKGSYGKLSSYSLRDYDEVLWPEGTDPLPVCSWKDFLSIWKSEFPFLKIRNPCEDTCAECHKIRNSFRVLDRATASISAAPPPRTACSGRQTGIEGSDSDDCSSIMSEDQSVAESLNLSGVEYPVEAIILEASDHATNAHNQRLLASSRIAEAKASAQLSWEERRYVICFVFVLFFFYYYF